MQELTDTEALVRLSRRQVTQVVNDETRCITQVRPASEHQVQILTHDLLAKQRHLRTRTHCYDYS